VIVVIATYLEELPLEALIRLLKQGEENSPCDRDQIREDFTNGGRGLPPKHLKFFLLVF